MTLRVSNFPGIGLLVAFAIITPGCLGATSEPTLEPSADESSPAATVSQDPWDGADRVTLADVGGLGWQFDFFCSFGGGPRFTGDGLVIPVGASALEITITSMGAFTDIQVGHLVGTADIPDYADSDSASLITWLPATWTPSGSHDVALAMEDSANGAPPWHFYQQMNLPAEQDCYTGIGAGEYRITIDAVRSS